MGCVIVIYWFKRTFFIVAVIFYTALIAINNYTYSTLCMFQYRLINQIIFVFYLNAFVLTQTVRIRLFVLYKNKRIRINIVDFVRTIAFDICLLDTIAMHRPSERHCHFKTCCSVSQRPDFFRLFAYFIHSVCPQSLCSSATAVMLLGL